MKGDRVLGLDGCVQAVSVVRIFTEARPVVRRYFLTYFVIPTSFALAF